MDQLRERVLISRDSCPEIAQTRGHRGRKRCEAAAGRSWMAGWRIQSGSVSRGPVVQIGQAVTIRSVAVRSSDDKQVSVALAGLGLQPDRQFTKGFSVFFRNGAPPAVPFIKSSEVEAENCCMQLIEAAVFAKDLR